MPESPQRRSIAALPTPLERCDALRRAWGGPHLWVKRDDLTGFGLSGNKVRKLEYHLAAAEAAGADTLVTCGAAQSNHCRATALVAARFGLACLLFLRTGDGAAPPRPVGNHLVSRLAGADIRYVDHAWYRRRDAHMAQAAADLAAAGRTAWVIPEGASDGLGMHGYVRAAAEAESQLAALGVDGAVHWHAASSGGTTAGLAAALFQAGSRSRVVAVSVSDPARGLAERIHSIWDDAYGTGTHGLDTGDIELRDDYVGLGYGLATDAELDTQIEATRRTGLLFDPAYTGKALHGLRVEIAAGRFSPDDHVVFWHTGGGFAALAFDYGAALDR